MLIRITGLRAFLKADQLSLDFTQRRAHQRHGKPVMAHKVKTRTKKGKPTSKVATTASRLASKWGLEVTDSITMANGRRFVTQLKGPGLVIDVMNSSPEGMYEKGSTNYWRIRDERGNALVEDGEARTVADVDRWLAAR